MSGRLFSRNSKQAERTDLQPLPREGEVAKNDACDFRALARALNGEVDLTADEWRIGQLMAAQRDAGMMDVGGRPKTGLRENPVPTLADAGIDKNLADRARKLAGVEAAS